MASDGSIGTPRAIALAELAQQVRPLLDDFLAVNGATPPPTWAALTDWLAWCIADGAISGALLALQSGTERRLALIEIVEGVPGIAAPTSPLPRLSEPSVSVFARCTSAWSPDHADGFQRVGWMPVAAQPRVPAPRQVDAVRRAAQLTLVRRVDTPS